MPLERRSRCTRRSLRIDVGNLSHIYRVIKGVSVFDPDELIRSIR